MRSSWGWWVVADGDVDVELWWDDAVDVGGQEAASRVDTVKVISEVRYLTVSTALDSHLHHPSLFSFSNRQTSNDYSTSYSGHSARTISFNLLLWNIKFDLNKSMSKSLQFLSNDNKHELNKRGDYILSTFMRLRPRLLVTKLYGLIEKSLTCCTHLNTHHLALHKSWNVKSCNLLVIT
jgi:hypothetical protein